MAHEGRREERHFERTLDLRTIYLLLGTTIGICIFQNASPQDIILKAGMHTWLA